MLDAKKVVLAVVVSGLVGFLVGRQKTNEIPVVPDDSPVHAVPPRWAIDVGLRLNTVFRSGVDATMPAQARAMLMAEAFWESTVMYAMAYYRIVEHLPATCEQVAAKLELNSDFLCRFMRAAVTLGILKGNFESTAVGDELLKPSVRAYVLMVNEEELTAWRATIQSLRTGQSGFKEAYGVDIYDYYAKDRTMSAQFDLAMTFVQPVEIGPIIKGYAFHGTVCDIGGGHGKLLTEIGRHYPDTKLVLFDRPDTASAWSFENRSTAIGGSFFDPMPNELRECDIFILKHILHNWDDASCRKILHNLKSVRKPSAKLLVIDFIMEARPGHGILHRILSRMDLNMLAKVKAGGKERSVDEFAALVDVAPSQIRHVPLSHLAVGVLEITSF